MNYAYLRVSTKEQNLDRQIDEVRNSGIHIDRECHELQSGKDFKSRSVYQNLKKRLMRGGTHLLFVLLTD